MTARCDECFQRRDERFGRVCFVVAKPAHGSVRRVFARFIAAARSNAAGLSIFERSLQRTGIATGAPARARSDQLATLVAPRVLRSQSMKMRPLRSALLAC